MNKKLLLVSVLALLAVPSFASVVAVTMPGALGANDSLDWGQLGPDITTVTGPVDVLSALGYTVNVSNGTNDLWSLQQGNSWNGNFNPGDNLLYNQATGPVALVFLIPIRGFGARFQSSDFGPFSIFITAFDATHTSLGSATIDGVSDGAADGSAAFLGLLSTSADISSVEVNVQVGRTDNAFALGSLSIAEAVPEPSTMLLAFGGMLAVVARKFKTRRS
jgi:hypothetical protein